ncbi:MAG TPA: NAD(P)H-dependent oxidoreductase [Ilumatobacteraceae bacterium]|nr:NAD(P)H-dependent oxidoreductase [Ilumatobacteraceae bacterium]
MRALLVVDAIRDDGVFIREIADAAIAGLQRHGHDVDVIDLAARRYSPVMTSADRRAYFSDDPLICSETSEHADLVRRADSLVFVYPSTLSMVTPGLKGWIERTFVPGVAFTLGDRTGSKRGLSNIRRLTGIAVYDDSRLDVLSQGDNGRRLIRRNIRLCGGLRTRSRWIAMYGYADADDHDRARFLVDVERRLARS